MIIIFIFNIIMKVTAKRDGYNNTLSPTFKSMQPITNQ